MSSGSDFHLSTHPTQTTESIRPNTANSGWFGFLLKAIKPRMAEHGVIAVPISLLFQGAAPRLVHLWHNCSGYACVAVSMARASDLL